MTAQRRPDSKRRRLGWLMLLVAALLTRLTAPEGWMPVASAAGGFEITLCNGMAGGATVMAPHGKMHHQMPQKGQTGDHPCAFAGMAIADAPPPLPQVTMPVAANTSAHAIGRIDLLPGRGLAAPPPPATGPPARA